ncbi:ArsS family sensor histidine kinase [Arcobacter aquimarinus]|uniref:histidine kinase n=1 Tax=Arcobacter aquimarinus TaxID=1315211 RepID=A0AAE7B3X0_9BACT|nr:ArsS family sensor histidine kinase [Arcobacter aquimarinus]MCB9096941.1 HAMP domain-containing histidine kinase [Arcobacter sp.]QKE25249.1 two-component system sensor histidine kinase [Arcobacter aquimarinus]RXI36304.1 histidine kinase [Arcobacter aquimarinus]
MNRQSIFFTITVSFIISILLVVVSFLILLTHNYKTQENQLLDKYVYVSKMVNKQDFRFSETFIKNLEDINYKLIFEKSQINAITYNPKTKVLVERVHPKHNDIFRVLNLDDVNYVYIKKRGETILIKDEDTSHNDTSIYIILVFAILFITIVLVYLITLRKLMPLKILKDKVKTLGDENFDFECCNTKGKDEVSLLAVEFKKSAEKLKNLKEARNIFIRNIMHELKTPITKGKFLTSLAQNEENNEKLKSVFNRLESLINEFASIEELISSNKNIDKKFYFLDDIIDNAKDILMIEDEHVISKYENKKLEVNFKLFSIAVKNLIDNAIKYSPNKEVIIKTEDENIIFENLGLELEAPFEKYFEPFFSNEDKSKDSFGLGLYIVHNILKANGYILEYEYKNETNRFICKKDETFTI